MCKGICRVYKHSQRNWTHPYTNTKFVLPQRHASSIETQGASDYEASVGAHGLASSVSYQITIQHVNTDVNNNADSWLFETPRKNNHSSSCFYDTITTNTIQNLFKLPPP